MRNININIWNQRRSLQLEIKSFRKSTDEVIINRQNKSYKCTINENKDIILVNDKQQKLCYSPANGKLLKADKFDIKNTYIKALIEDAKLALGLSI